MTEVIDRIGKTRPRRFRPYPEYRDSGVEWLGEIPPHWKVGRLKDHGVLFGGAGFPHDYQGTEDEVLPFYKVGDLSVSSDGRYMGQAPHTVSFEIAAELSAHVIPEDSIIYAKIGVALLLNRRRITTRACCIDNNMSAYVPHRGELASEWAFYWTTIVDFAALANPGAVPSLSEGDQADIPIAIPPMVEQRAIAAFLDRETAEIDGLVEREDRLIELLQEKRTALITRTVTRGLDPNVPMKDSGVEWLGKIPAHWEVKRTKFAATLRSGHTPSRQNPEYWKDCTIPWFGLADVWQIRDGQVEYVHVTAEKISEIGMANSAARLLPEGTVILSRTASVGFSAILGVDMATTQDFVNWICGPFLQPEYLLYVLRAMGSEFRRLKMGSTHQTIYMPDVGRFSTPVPPVLEQDQIVAFIRKETAVIDALIAKVHQAVGHLKEFRTALISAAVTGKIDVREEVS